MQDIDMDKDNKISYEEFKKWWLSGRQGLSPTMRRLLAFKLKTLKFMDTISGTLQDVIADATSEQVEIATNSLKISINDFQHAGTTLYVRFMGFSPELKTEFERIKSIHQFQIPEEDQKAYISISFDVKDGNADDIVKQIDEFFQ